MVNKRYESNLFTIGKHNDDVLPVSKLQAQKNLKVQDSNQEKKYKCEKCARTYKHKHALSHHQRYACEVMRQFSCKLCGKEFKYKHHVHRHIDQVHLKLSTQLNI